MSPFWKAFLWVAIPIILFGLVSTPGELGLLWFVGGLVWVGGAVAMLTAFASGRSQTGLGILAALAVGSLALALTCFANLSNLQF